MLEILVQHWGWTLVGIWLVGTVITYIHILSKNNWDIRDDVFVWMSFTWFVLLFVMFVIWFQKKFAKRPVSS
jgi:hypothetical protein